jgi:hydroxymethylglutaryl-CoA lyase
MKGRRNGEAVDPAGADPGDGAAPGFHPQAQPDRPPTFAPGMPARVRFVEVGPRDGFQNLDDFVPTADKIALVNRLVGLGFERVEVTSFVHPRAVPQLRDAEEVLAAARRDGARLMVLVPNRRGAERALVGRPDMLNFVLSASESHNRANLNRTVAESLSDLDDTLRLAAEAGLPLRLTIATSFGCPYEGEVHPDAVLALARRGAAAGAAEVCLGDTTGMADPRQVFALFTRLGQELPGVTPAVHLHNTRGSGAANLLAALAAGVDVVDGSVGGLGGCPYAPGATGNVCSEDMVHLLEAMGIATGVHLTDLVAVAVDLERQLGTRLSGQVMRAGPSWQLAAVG